MFLEKLNASYIEFTIGDDRFVSNNVRDSSGRSFAAENERRGDDAHNAEEKHRNRVVKPEAVLEILRTLHLYLISMLRPVLRIII